MKQFKIEVEYDEPMKATALIQGETEEDAIAAFVEMSKQRGLENTRIISLEEISEEEAILIRDAYQNPTENRTVN